MTKMKISSIMEVNMEILILTGTLAGAFFVGFFMIGFAAGMKYQKKKASENAVEINDKNINAYKEIAEWLNWGGKQ